MHAQNGGEWTSWVNGTNTSSFGGRACDENCLFNLTADPSEHNNLAASHPAVMAAMLARFAEIEKVEYHPPSANPAPEDESCCAAAAKNGGFLVPWTSPPAPPAPAPPVPLGPCVGVPGSAGWRILNNTGGGGPAYATYPAADAGLDSLEQCRRRCCASPYCVSVVLHTDGGGHTGCYLNGANGTKAPYGRKETILAYVNRST